MKHLFRHTFIRFLIAGAANTLFGWSIYTVTILAGFEPWVALICGIVVGIAFNFVSIGGYAFRQFTLKRLPQFAASYSVIYATNLISLDLLARKFDPITAQLILTAPMAILSYILLSRFVFKKHEAPCKSSEDS